MSHPVLTIALPSKGRLQENAFAFFARSGLTIRQSNGNRDYRGAIIGMPDIEVAFLSASEIAGELARGAVHLGVTGRDLVEEALEDPRAKLELLTPLAFGHADVVVAVPEAWIDVYGMADLEDVAAELRRKTGRRLRVATKYLRLTARHFKQHGLSDYRIVESLGATEGAPAAGSADIIVDITTTGATLKANGLKVLDDGLILKSEAHLVASLEASWSAPARASARQVLARIQAEQDARRKREMRVFGLGAMDGNLGAVLDAHQVEVLLDHDAMLCLLVDRDAVGPLADQLIEAGAARVLTYAPGDVFSAANPHYDRFLARLG